VQPADIWRTSAVRRGEFPLEQRAQFLQAPGRQVVAGIAPANGQPLVEATPRERARQVGATGSDAVEPYVDVSIETSYTRIEQRDDACGFSGRGRWSRGSE